MAMKASAFFYLSLALSGHPKTPAFLVPGQTEPTQHKQYVPQAEPNLFGSALNRAYPSNRALIAGPTSIPRGPAFFGD